MTTVNQTTPEMLGVVPERKTLRLSILVDIPLEDSDEDDVADIEEIGDAIDGALNDLRAHGRAKVTDAVIRDSYDSYDTFYKDAINGITFERTAREGLYW